MKDLSKDFDARMTLRRKMLKHLNITLSEDATLQNREDIRATMIGCSCCRTQEDCSLWLVWRRLGTPDGCIASDSFLRLQAVSEHEARQDRPVG